MSPWAGKSMDRKASSALLTALDRLIDLDAGVPEERKR